jgi:hypothetical protein
MAIRKKTAASSTPTISNYINHIVFVLDKSGSMGPHRDTLIKVVDNQVAKLARDSKILDQETRVSIYLFDQTTECIVYDKDVLRLPSLKGLYHPNGGTALLDATHLAIEELGQTPELHGEHAFLVYVLTDGEENSSRTGAFASVQQDFKNLPDNWTVAALVPDVLGVKNAKDYGFPKDNIVVWNAAAAGGMDEAGDVIGKATENFMRQRASGVKGTRTLFSFDTSAISKKTVKANLDALKAETYELLQVRKADNGAAIKSFVEKRTGQGYVQGSAYYELSKKEKIQSRKQICLKEVSTGKVYGGEAVRDLLQLPDHEVRVNPATHPQFVFFVQSTSVNRKLVQGTELLVIHE